MKFKPVIFGAILGIFFIHTSYQAEEAYSFENSYQQALKFRDHKVQGYTPEISTQIAEKTFYTLSMFGNPKAMHNYAMLKFKKKDLLLAYYWFKKAEELGVEASTKNMSLMDKKGLVYKEPVSEQDALQPDQLAFCAACFEANQQLILANNPAVQFWVKQAVAKRHVDANKFINLLDICNFVIMQHKKKGAERRVQNLIDKEINSIKMLVPILSRLYPTEKKVREFVQVESDVFFNEPKPLRHHLDFVIFYTGLVGGTPDFPGGINYLSDLTVAKNYLDRIVERLRDNSHQYKYENITETDMGYVNWIKEVMRLIETIGQIPTAAQINESLRLATEADEDKLIVNATLLQIEQSIRLTSILGNTPTAAQINESVRLETEVDEDKIIICSTPLEIEHSIRLTSILGSTPTTAQINESLRLSALGEVYNGGTVAPSQIEPIQFRVPFGQSPTSEDIKLWSDELSRKIREKINSSMENNAGDESVQFNGNWTETFYLKDGSKVVHTPQFVSLGGMSSGAGVYIKSVTYNGLPVSDVGLQLPKNCSREEFLKALLASGLYG